MKKATKLAAVLGAGALLFNVATTSVMAGPFGGQIAVGVAGTFGEAETTASETLKSILKELNYKNLDESDEFTEKNTTTEFLAHTIFQRMEAKVHEGLLGTLALSLNSMRVTLHESHVAWAAYEGPIDKGMKE